MHVYVYVSIYVCTYFNIYILDLHDTRQDKTKT